MASGASLFGTLRLHEASAWPLWEVKPHNTGTKNLKVVHILSISHHYFKAKTSHFHLLQDRTLLTMVLATHVTAWSVY